MANGAIGIIPVFLVSCALVLVGCASTSAPGISADANDIRTAISTDDDAEFRPIEPMQNYSFFTLVQKADGSQKGQSGATPEWKEMYWSSLATDITQINKYLPNHSASVVVQKKDLSGNLKFVTATVSGEAGSYRILMDYLKYRIEPIYSEPSETASGKQEYLGTGKVGVGLRISADVVTTKSGVDLGSLFSLGVAAKQGDVRGSLSVAVIGIDSKDVTNLIPLTAVIDESSIQQALQSLASIKTKMYDPGVMLTPHVVAIRKASASNQSERMIKELGKPQSAPNTKP